MSSATDPAEIVRRYHLAIDKLDFDAIGGFFADDAVYISNGIGELKSRDAIMAAFRVYFAEFPDQMSKDHLIEAISKVSARSVWTLTATSTKTGKTIQRSGSETVSLDAAGKIVSVEVFDAI